MVEDLNLNQNKSNLFVGGFWKTNQNIIQIWTWSNLMHIREKSKSCVVIYGDSNLMFEMCASIEDLCVRVSILSILFVLLFMCHSSICIHIQRHYMVTHMSYRSTHTEFLAQAKSLSISDPHISTSGWRMSLSGRHIRRIGRHMLSCLQNQTFYQFQVNA